MKTQDEPKKLAVLLYVLCFPPSLCPSNPTPTLLARKPHIPPPCYLLTTMYPSTFISPFPHSPILLAVLPLSSRIPSLPCCLLVPRVEPLFPLSPPLCQSALSFLLHLSQLQLGSSQLASITPISSFPSWWTPTLYLHFQQKHLCTHSLLPHLRPHLTYTWKKQELSLQGWSHSAAQSWAGTTQAWSAGTSLGAVREWAQAGSPVGCSAPEAGVCWWMGTKVFRK